MRPRPPSIIVILNAAAGSASKHSNHAAELGELFRACGCRAEIVRADGNPIEAARDAAARAGIVVAAGGDGTVSGVAAGIVGSSAALGILPLGTLNHFAKDLHIPLDLGQAAAVVAAGHTTEVDVGRVNGRVFVNNSSIGIYPDIVEERETLQGRGHRKWPATAIAILHVLTTYRGVVVTLDANERQRTWHTPFVFIGNNEYAIDGARLGARERIDQGKLFAYLTLQIGARALPLLAMKALVGRASQSGAFEIVPAAELTIDARFHRRIDVALDGEVATMTTPLRYRTCPRALPVVVPRSSIQ
jgi:diacylglycerol kinase family enzyme